MAELERGTSRKDELFGDAGNDTLLGFAGNDSLRGLGGNDILDGGTGNDYMHGGDGNDKMREFRNSGSDKMDGSFGLDVVDYRRNDTGTLPITLNITAGTVSRLNSLTGNTDLDTLVNIEKVVATSSSADVITAEGFTFSVGINLSATTFTANKSGFTTISRFENAVGGTRGDTLTGSTGNNSLDGQGGNDRYVFLSGFGTDTIIDSAGGADTLDLSNMGQGFIINLTSGDDNEVESESNADTINWDSNIIEVVIGSSGADEITGSTNNESLSGSGGADTFFQINAHGNDTINGGSGTDILDYSQSTQKIVYDTASNLVSAFDSDGILVSQDTFTNVEQLIGSNNVNSVIDASNQENNITINLQAGTATNLSSGLAQITGFKVVEAGAGDDEISGNSSGNSLNGNDGNDQINGEGGNDTLNGGDGNDVLDGGTGSDTFVYDDDWGSDTLNTGTGANDIVDLSLVNKALIVNLTTSDGNEVEDVPEDDSAANSITWDNSFIDSVITGSNNDSVTGNTEANQITTGLGNDTVNAGDGNDTISGGSGNDTLNGDDGNDTFLFVDNEEPSTETDTIDGGDNNDFLDFRRLTTVVTYNSADGTVAGKRILNTVSNIELLVGSSGLGDTIDASEETVDLSIVLGHLSVTSTSGRLGTNSGFVGTNVITVFEGFENIESGSGDDTILSNDAINVINGGQGSDLILEDYNADTYVFDNTWGNDILYRPLQYDFDDENGTLRNGKLSETTDNGGSGESFVSSLEVKYAIGGGYSDPDSDHDRLDFSSITAGLTAFLRAAYDRAEVTDGTNTLNWVENRSAYPSAPTAPPTPEVMFEEIETGSGDDEIFGNGVDNIMISNAGDDVVFDFDTGLEFRVSVTTGQAFDTAIRIGSELLFTYALQGLNTDVGDPGGFVDNGFYDTGGNDVYFDGAGSDIYNDANILDVSTIAIGTGIDLDDATSGGDDTYVFTRSDENAQPGEIDFIYDPSSGSQDSDTILFSGFSPSDFIITGDTASQGFTMTDEDENGVLETEVARDDFPFIHDLKLVCEVYGAPWTIYVLEYFMGGFIDDDTLRTDPDGSTNIRGNGHISSIVFDPGGDTNADLSGVVTDDITMTLENLIDFISF